MSEVKKPLWIECEVDCDEDYFHLNVHNIEGHDQGQEWDNSMKIEFIEHSAFQKCLDIIRLQREALKLIIDTEEQGINFPVTSPFGKIATKTIAATEKLLAEIGHEELEATTTALKLRIKELETHLGERNAAEVWASTNVVLAGGKD